MSQVLSAKQTCERALRAIGNFPIADSSADGASLREAMIWLDLILAENAGTNKLLFLIPSPDLVSFTVANGVGTYDLLDALGADAPVDGVQFPVSAHIVTPSGPSVVNFGGAIPGAIAVGQAVADLSTPANVPNPTTVQAINASAQQITLSGPSTVLAGETLQFSSSPATNVVSLGTIGGTGMVAGTSTFHRREVRIVTRDVFMAARDPNENGHPRMVYIDRLPDSQLYFHPFPAATDPGLYVLQLDVQTYAPNVAPAGVSGKRTQGETLTNFRQAWQRYLVAQLSHDLGAGPIFKIGEASLNRFGKMAAEAKERLEAFENREHDDLAPICEAFDAGDSDPRHEHHGGFEFGRY